ncbi:hypothetical protein EIP91_003467 [Steccherinum ochraceum]|uniref:Uncharacterized protein n=1 Tax=Steccherinum ochraceum TaxID=92696 RepID=A0A4R0RAF9_9APHY|nr:hypothetical protein EIP91_003467 [Steccherinum ochraceum]
MSIPHPSSRRSVTQTSASQAMWHRRQSRLRRHHDDASPVSHSTKEAVLLNAAGQYWSGRQGLFQRQNYVLRPKFTCRKKVMWKGSPLDASSVRVLDFFNHSTDIESLQRMVDAYCPVTQRLVCIRRIRTGSEELQTLLKLSRPGIRGWESGAHWNPCPPVIDMFEDDQSCSITFVVMPYHRISRSRLLFNKHFLYQYSDILTEAGYMMDCIEFFCRFGIRNVLSRWPYMIWNYHWPKDIPPPATFLQFFESDGTSAHPTNRNADLMSLGAALLRALGPLAAIPMFKDLARTAEDLLESKYSVGDFWTRFYKMRTPRQWQVLTGDT